MGIEEAVMFSDCLYYSSLIPYLILAAPWFALSYFFPTIPSKSLFLHLIKWFELVENEYVNKNESLPDVMLY